MGSFPNLTAGQLLKAIFIDKFSSGAVATASSTVCSMYNSAANTAGAGFFTATAAGAQPLHLGLLISAGAVGGLTVNAMGDANISSNTATLAGTGWAATTGSGSSSTTSVECLDSNYNRVAFTASFTAVTDGGTIATVTLPLAAVNFASSGMQAAVTGAAVGFFISSFAGKGTGADANRPHVIAYGQLSTAKALGVGDQPTFAAGAITITLD